MTPLSEFFAPVLRYAPSAPDPLIEAALRESAIEMCRRTRAWREVFTVETVGDEDEIMCVPSDSRIFQIEHVHFNGEKLDAAPYGGLPSTEIGMPQTFSQVSANSITLSPRGAGTLIVSIFLTPTEEADCLPDIMRDLFREAVCNGAAARLLIMPDKAFTNPQLASTLFSLFERKANENFDYNVRGQHRAASRSRPDWL